MIIVLPVLANTLPIIDCYQTAVWITIYLTFFDIPKLFFIPIILMSDLLRVMVWTARSNIRPVRNRVSNYRAHTLFLKGIIRPEINVSLMVRFASDGRQLRQSRAGIYRPSGANRQSAGGDGNSTEEINVTVPQTSLFSKIIPLVPDAG